MRVFSGCRWGLTALALALPAILTVGCARGPQVPRPVHYPHVTLIPKDHVHTPTCGHFVDPRGGKHKYRRGHVHSPTCGHQHYMGVWTREATPWRHPVYEVPVARPLPRP